MHTQHLNRRHSKGVQLLVVVVAAVPLYVSKSTISYPHSNAHYCSLVRGLSVPFNMHNMNFSHFPSLSLTLCSSYSSSNVLLLLMLNVYWCACDTEFSSMDFVAQQ